MLHEFSSCLPFFLYHALRQKASSCFLHSNKQENAVISVIECKSIDLCGMRLPFHVVCGLNFCRLLNDAYEMRSSVAPQN